MVSAAVNIHAKDFQTKLARFCFANLEDYLKTKEFKSYPEEFDTVDCPLFVTWNKNGDLRGCIGTFASDPLGKTVQRFSLVSALQDSRFPPVSAAEVSSLDVHVSLLNNFEEI